MKGKFYHGTSKANWEKIKKEGVLWGKRNAPSRCTYLTPSKDEAKHWGEVVLEVEYDPTKGINNYCKDCWQFRVYDPIPLKDVKKLKVRHRKGVR